MRIGRGLKIPGSKYLEGRLLRKRTPNLVKGALKMITGLDPALLPNLSMKGYVQNTFHTGNHIT
jgi:hypothetical protein